MQRRHFDDMETLNDSDSQFELRVEEAAKEILDNTNRNFLFWERTCNESVTHTGTFTNRIVVPKFCIVSIQTETYLDVTFEKSNHIRLSIRESSPKRVTLMKQLTPKANNQKKVVAAIKSRNQESKKKRPKYIKQSNEMPFLRTTK